MKTKKLRVLGLWGACLLALSACGWGGAASHTSQLQADGSFKPALPSPGQAAGSGPEKSPAGVSPQAQTPEGPRVQRTAQITLDVGAGLFDSTLNDVIAIVDQAGGYVSGSQAGADDGQPMRSGRVTFQVPAARFDDVFVQIRKKGTPQAISISGNDVSLQYVDLQARLRNLEAQRNAMLALMQQARSVNDTIQIQNQLGQVTGQIEELNGQISFLDHSTRFATVAVTIRESTVSRDDWGLRSAANQALHNLVNVVAFLVLALGTLAPLLIPGVVLAFIGWRGRGRLRRPRSVPATGASPAE